jgi:hypothetical protein
MLDATKRLQIGCDLRGEVLELQPRHVNGLAGFLATLGAAALKCPTFVGHHTSGSKSGAHWPVTAELIPSAPDALAL